MGEKGESFCPMTDDRCRDLRRLGVPSFRTELIHNFESKDKPSAK
jgi:hypothetical protein